MFIMFNIHVSVCAYMHACMCMCVHGAPLHIPTPTPNPINPPVNLQGGPLESVKTLELMKIIQFCLKI